jgi:hypothetical protein
MVQLEEIPVASMHTLCTPLQHSDASVTHLTLTDKFPPRIVAKAHAKGLKGWQAIDAPTDGIRVG